ncbi:MAG: peptidase S41 [Bacteroidia bacterium]
MKNLSLVFLTLMILTSCQGIWMDSVPENDQNEIVRDICNEIGSNYSFFEMKEIDWESVSNRYDSLSQSPMNNQNFFSLLSDLIAELDDGHASLYAGFNTFLHYDVFLDYESNFNFSFIQRQYLGEINEIGPFVYAKLNENIGYLYYGSFSDNFTNDQLKNLGSYFSDCDGLIIDVRDNNGGAADNISQLMQFIVKDEQHFGNLVTRSNYEGKAVYTSEEILIEPIGDKPLFKQEIAVLTNRGSYSSCNVFAAYMSQLPNVTLVGDTTGGGTGLAVGSVLANGWKYRYSAGEFTLADGSSFELGFAPDETVFTTAADEVNGKDMIIERALEVLK